MGMCRGMDCRTPAPIGLAPPDTANSNCVCTLGARAGSSRTAGLLPRQGTGFVGQIARASHSICLPELEGYLAVLERLLGQNNSSSAPDSRMLAVGLDALGRPEKRKIVDTTALGLLARVSF